MNAGSLLWRTFRIAAIAAPVAAGIGYATIFGIDAWFRVECHIGNGFSVASLCWGLPWCALASCQGTGFRRPPGLLDVWRVIVIAISGLGIEACREVPWITSIHDYCDFLGAHSDHADAFLGVDLVLLVLCIPATVISLVIAVAAVMKSKEPEDMERIFPW